MHDLNAFKGYRPSFLGRGLSVSLPAMSRRLSGSIAPIAGSRSKVLRYHHFSVVQNSRRRLPFFTACNIDGGQLRKIRRKDIFPGGRDKWDKDPRIAEEHQLGMEFYDVPKSDFDRGHMTKREDAQWGKSDEDAILGAQTTFYFTNAAPQRKEVNQAIWRDLEDYLLNDEAIERKIRINVFTGPVFDENDPLFINPLKDGSTFQLPVLFWKIIYFAKGRETLARVGFLMGQEHLVIKHGLVVPGTGTRDLEDRLFMNFEEADTYQVNVSTIEKLTHLRFPEAMDPFRDDRPTKLVLEEVGLRSLDGPGKPQIRGLVL